MELISQRVARGLEIKPRSHRAKSGSAIDTDTKSDIIQTGEGPAKAAGSVGLSTSVDWKKWGNRIVDTKARSHEVKKLFKDGQVSFVVEIAMLIRTHDTICAVEATRELARAESAVSQRCFTNWQHRTSPADI